jgi:hypothetical protein
MATAHEFASSLNRAPPPGLTNSTFIWLLLTPQCGIQGEKWLECQYEPN